MPRRLTKPAGPSLDDVTEAFQEAAAACLRAGELAKNLIHPHLNAVETELILKAASRTGRAGELLGEAAASLQRLDAKEP